ncbi:hypothetical protein PC129_g23331 [Phytophthora cactorum]|uniref:Uncharacterized protein n=1 Tax=Phytophthora cactorum TaxID=29920 RepID=A0A329S7N4_9STRA|nr:hypothetical protein Pcac1_g17358 [Phytophthora cactorum]KAG2792315.1 hypothetical protein PC111_g23521 [Phytophthora cactorum]KAG2792754.1 hypothetical protein PC112_g23730 [Phytophthora cactorum]KAG2843454.1 hypothetical protein PC113_g18594 [Phytophthora cactorum]KAG2872271.1 hypothetical protein PC114_g26473 [Phytophthora cactorum]
MGEWVGASASESESADSKHSEHHRGSASGLAGFGVFGLPLWGVHGATVVAY